MGINKGYMGVLEKRVETALAERGRYVGVYLLPSRLFWSRAATVLGKCRNLGTLIFNPMHPCHLNCLHMHRYTKGQAL